jgi:hypothetical protein
MSRESGITTTGWTYQQTNGGDYVAHPLTGVSPVYTGDGQNVKYTVQAADALTQGDTYTVYIEQAEIRDRS